MKKRIKLVALSPVLLVVPIFSSSCKDNKAGEFDKNKNKEYVELKSNYEKNKNQGIYVALNKESYNLLNIYKNNDNLDLKIANKFKKINELYNDKNKKIYESYFSELTVLKDNKTKYMSFFTTEEMLNKYNKIDENFANDYQISNYFNNIKSPFSFDRIRELSSAFEKSYLLAKQYLKSEVNEFYKLIKIYGQFENDENMNISTFTISPDFANFLEVIKSEKNSLAEYINAINFKELNIENIDMQIKTLNNLLKINANDRTDEQTEEIKILSKTIATKTKSIFEIQAIKNLKNALTEINTKIKTYNYDIIIKFNNNISLIKQAKSEEEDSENIAAAEDIVSKIKNALQNVVSFELSSNEINTKIASFLNKLDDIIDDFETNKVKKIRN
ncbi:UNVERIFIED_CONTAM: hypothetical protein O8I53_11915, partial [Campylobacter lari]